jgi:hypothetical protein
MAALDDYYKQFLTLNQQRGMTGNQDLNRGMDASLAEGYLDASMKNNQRQQAIDLQKQNQNWSQAFNEKAMKQQSDQFTTNLAGGAASGIVNMATTGKLTGAFKGAKDLVSGTTPQDISTDWGGAPQGLDYSNMGEASDWMNEANQGTAESLSQFDWGESLSFMDGLFG